LLLGCGRPAPRDVDRRADPYAAVRAEMVDQQIAGRDVTDEKVLAAMRAVPRHEFVPEQWREFAYDDSPLPIGLGQTISQPYIVAVMTELAAVPEGGRVLEVGTGSGYGAAVLAQVASHVYTIEILEPLAERAKATLARLGYDNVTVRAGDGYRGWPEQAPFDAIVVTAAPLEVPEPLKQQLKVGGRLVLPVGARGGRQELKLITRTRQGFREETVFGVKFVPMTGEAAKGR
jgi:protein-L-isoaspartate(D-aspartate) O-methyltransferase